MLQNRIIGVLGTKGFGKSTLVKQMIRTRQRCLIYDSMADHGDVAYQVDGMVTALEYLEKNEDKFRVAVKPSSPEFDFEYYCEALDRLARPHVEDTNAFIEEVDRWCSANFNHPSLFDAISYGRNRQCNLVYTAKTFASISRFLTSQTDSFALFHLREPIYLDDVGRRIGDELRDRIEELPIFHYLIWSPGEGFEGEFETEP